MSDAGDGEPSSLDQHDERDRTHKADADGANGDSADDGAIPEPEAFAATDPDELGGVAEGSTIEQAARSTPPGRPLRVRDLRKRFGGLTAVDGVSFDVEEGSLTGLIGPNGAGKSTLFNLITGVYAPDAGTVSLRNEEITGRPPYEIASRGLVRTFQIARELEDMTVIENVMLAPKGQRGESLWRSVTPLARGSVASEERDLRARAWEMLERFEIDHLAGERAGNLSGGQRKLLELARALLTDPDVFLLDEPLAGVNPTLEDKLLGRIHDLRAEGYTFLLVEHDMDVIMDNCERVIVLDQGSILADGTPAEIRENQRVVDAYLGAR